jgi:hypothetical protein
MADLSEYSGTPYLDAVPVCSSFSIEVGFCVGLMLLDHTTCDMLTIHRRGFDLAGSP